MSSSSASPEFSKDIVIVGAGIIGLSTAYYLSRNHDENINSITLVDRSGCIAPAASGKAGGFLALDWNDYSSVGPLTRRSFQLHADLAEELDGEKIQYRRLTCSSISVAETSRKKPNGRKLQGVEWADDNNTIDAESELQPGNIVGIRPLGDEDTIAQVHPKKLCDAMWKAIESNKNIETNLVEGTVKEKAEYDSSGKLIGAKLDDGTIINAGTILFSCGPWTEHGNCMVGVKYHSAIIPTPRVLSQSVFFDGYGDPEVYPRPDSTAYCCGFPDPPVRVTEFPGKEEVRDEKIEEIVNSVRNASGGINGALGTEPELKQSCYLPTTPDNLPLMGEIRDQKGCFIASGHGCWGILMGPATGEAMASLMTTGASSKYVKMESFRPERFENKPLW